MDAHESGSAARLGLRDPWTGALAIGAWDEQPPTPSALPAVGRPAEPASSAAYPAPSDQPVAPAGPTGAVPPTESVPAARSAAPPWSAPPLTSPVPGPWATAAAASRTGRKAGTATDPSGAGTGADAARAVVYREVREGEAFRGVRRRYRRFAFPAAAAFMAWYLAYVVAATTAPGLMGRSVAGPVNVAMLAGLAQFVTTFALAWGYAWHARTRRDRAALDVRWETQERTR